MKTLLPLFLVLILNLTFGKSAPQKDEVELPQTPKLQFFLEEIVSKDSLIKANHKLNPNGAQVKGILNIEINDLVDQILENLQNIIIRNGMEPLQLEDSTLKLIPVGSIKFTNGWLQDLSTIGRNGDVVISVHTSKKITTFLLPLNFRYLLFTYKYHTKALLLSIKGDVLGKIDNVKLTLEVNYDANTNSVSLGKLSMKHSGRVTVKFTGNGLVDWLTNAMTSVVTTVLHPILIKLVESFVKSGAKDIIDAVNEYIHGINFLT